MSTESPHQRVLHIKNMVCPRCIMVVREELEKLGLHVLEVKLGTAVVVESDEVDETAINAAMTSKGFELLHDKLEELVESIKVAVLNLIYSDEISSLATNLSTYLAEKLGKDYSTISTAFKASEGIALNRYIVLQKVERVKELLTYNELPLSAIATKLGYKSLQHLSRQFKEVTGTTLNKYKNQGGADRHPIDNLY
ncbi:helix-turn-helix domain-containing protein [Pontibacter virosus]|uniref:Helix-turn-helix protein n=1 Tax=Pontibacter virosus TaxID=1765052 RepID=A0A2U1B4T6_9BACT|nr:AraC family transcriptional regulator [Pontibacter virosus]PVY43693.1 helix-turn-helix protein [Pontibacter virosus]